MSKKFGILLILTLITLEICELITCEKQNELQQGFTTRCDELCSTEIQEDLGPDCQRGCQYFSIEFLVSASNKNEVNDLETLNEKCRLSCLEAYVYVRGIKKDACDIGCRKMKELQGNAPYVNGWIIFMGAPDNSMVLLQPDLESTPDEDWVLLDSVLRNNNDYDQYKVTETRIQTVPAHDCNRILLPKVSWFWIFPTLAIIFTLLYFGRKYELNNVNEQINEKFLTDPIAKSERNHDFVVNNDTYFYPTPAIPPPKYNEAIEALLTDEEVMYGHNDPRFSTEK